MPIREIPFREICKSAFFPPHERSSRGRSQQGGSSELAPVMVDRRLGREGFTAGGGRIALLRLFASLTSLRFEYYAFSLLMGSFTTRRVPEGLQA